MTRNESDQNSDYDEYASISPLTPLIAALVMFALLLVGAVGIASSGLELEPPVNRLQQAPDVDSDWRWEGRERSFSGMYRSSR